MEKPRIALLRYGNVVGLGQRLGQVLFDRYGSVIPYIWVGKRGRKKPIYASDGTYILWHFTKWDFPHCKVLGDDPIEALAELKRAQKELKATGTVRFDT